MDYRLTWKQDVSGHLQVSSAALCLSVSLLFVQVLEKPRIKPSLLENSKQYTESWVIANNYVAMYNVCKLCNRSSEERNFYSIFTPALFADRSRCIPQKKVEYTSYCFFGAWNRNGDDVTPEGLNKFIFSR